MKEDVDNDGALDMSELKKAFKKTHVPFTDESIMAIFDHFDKNGDKKLQIDEVRKFLETQYLTSTPENSTFEPTPVLEPVPSNVPGTVPAPETTAPESQQAPENTDTSPEPVTEPIPKAQPPAETVPEPESTPEAQPPAETVPEPESTPEAQPLA